jgi:ferredoxin
MGVHEWSYDSAVSPEDRFPVPHVDKTLALKDRKVEVELGFDRAVAYREAERCLNCDVQTVFITDKCIECDGCVDICPTECINFLPNDEEPALRTKLRMAADELDQDLYESDALAQTGRVMVRTRTSAFTAGSVPSAALPAPGICSVFSIKSRRRASHAAKASDKRFRYQVCERQRHRLCQCQRDVRQGHLPHGHPRKPTEYLPVEYPGHADLVRGSG